VEWDHDGTLKFERQNGAEMFQSSKATMRGGIADKGAAQGRSGR